MIKIAFYIESMILGGAEKQLINLVNHLDFKKYEVTVIAIFRNSVYSGYQFRFDDFFNRHVRYRTLIDNSNERLYRLYNHLSAHIDKRLIYSALIREKYDVEVAFYEGMPTEFVASSTNKFSRKYAWLHTDSNWLYRDKCLEMLRERRMIYEKYDEVIGVSKAAVDSFLSFFPGIKTRTIYNFLDLERIDCLANEKPTLLMRSECTTFVTVGRLVKVKGYDRLIDVFHELKTDGYCFRLILVGDGEEKDDLIAETVRRNMSDEIVFAGVQKNPYALMRNADYFISSSYVEGFSLVTCESIACGTPPLVTDVGGVREVLGDSGCGYLCENSKSGLYKVIRHVLEHPEERKALSEKCRRRREFFSPENCMKDFNRLFSGE